MKVAIVTTSYPDHAGDPSGHFVRAEARNLVRDGHEVVVVAPNGGLRSYAPRGEAEPRFSGIHAGDAFGWPGVAARVRENPWRAIDAMRWIAGASRAIAREQPDRVVAHWGIPNAWPIALRAREFEVVSHGGDVRLLLRMPRAIRSAIVRKIAARATSWRFVSRELYTSLDATLDRETAARLAKIARIEACAIEMPDVRDAIDAKRATFGSKRVVVAVGRLVASKRIDAVIDHVADDVSGPMLVVVGDGPDRSRLEARAHTRGIDARFVGRTDRDEALAWIGAADALLFASRSEGLSTVIREAQALGTKVVRV